MTAIKVASALLSGGILPVIAIIGTLALVVYTVMTHFDEFKNSLQDTGNKFAEVYNQYIAPFVENVKQTLATLWNDHLKPLFDSLQEIIMVIWFDALKPFIDWIITDIIPSVMPVLQSIWDTICSVVGNIIDIIKGVVDFFKGVIQFISGVFTGDWQKAWEGIKNIFKGVWEAIWGIISGVINVIIGGIEGMANGIIGGINLIIRCLNKFKISIPDWVPEFGGKTLGFNIPEMNKVSLPRLEKGGVLFEETGFIGGEYSGASSNPEIVTPQNIMYDTMKKALMDSNNGNNKTPLNITVMVGNKKIGQILLDDLRDKVRQTGKDIEVLVGGG